MSTVLGKTLHVCLARVIHIEELDFIPEELHTSKSYSSMENDEQIRRKQKSLQIRRVTPA